MTWCFCVPIVATTTCKGEMAAREAEKKVAFSGLEKATSTDLMFH